MDDEFDKIVAADAEGAVRMQAADHYSKLVGVIALALRGEAPPNTWPMLRELVNGTPLRLPPYHVDGLPDDYENGQVIERVISFMLDQAPPGEVSADERFDAEGAVPALARDFCRDVRAAWVVVNSTLEAVRTMQQMGVHIAVIDLSAQSDTQPGPPMPAPPVQEQAPKGKCPRCQGNLEVRWTNTDGKGVRPIWACPACTRPS